MPNAIDLNQACIPNEYSRLIARELRLQVRDLPGFLHLTQLTTEAFLEENTLLSPVQQIQILQNALSLSGDPTIGLRVGHRLSPMSHGMMGLLMNSSPNLLMMLKAIQAFVPTRMNFTRIELITTEDTLECHGHFDLDVDAEVLRVFSEAFALAFFEAAKLIIGRPLDEAELFFVHDQPEYCEQYQHYFPCKVSFSQSSTFVKLPLSICYIPNVSASQKNYAMAYEQCEKLLAQLFSERGTVSYQVKKIILSASSIMVSEEEVAADLFMSKRTLARKLKQEHTSFRHIRDDILSQQAINYLSETTMSVEAIAAQLNYYDSANFRRAFKRWFKLTPDQYRNQSKTAT